MSSSPHEHHQLGCHAAGQGSDRISEYHHCQWISKHSPPTSDWGRCWWMTHCCHLLNWGRLGWHMNSEKSLNDLEWGPSKPLEFNLSCRCVYTGRDYFLFEILNTKRGQGCHKVYASKSAHVEGSPKKSGSNAWHRPPSSSSLSSVLSFYLLQLSVWMVCVFKRGSTFLVVWLPRARDGDLFQSSNIIPSVCLCCSKGCWHERGPWLHRD